MHQVQTTTSLFKEDNALTKPHKIRPLLKSKAQWRCLNPSDISHINKYKPKMLSMLQITRIDFENIEIRPLCRAIKDLKRVSSLSFLQKELNSKHLLHLINTTNHWKNLGIWDCGLNREVLKALRVKRCKDLESLSIPSELNRFIKEGAAEDFFLQIKGLTRVKAFDIYVSKDNLKAILESELHWKSVRDINLEFLKRVQNCQKLLSKIQHVETLKLKFDWEYNVEVQDGQIWASFFQKAKNLKSLIITVNVHGDQGIEGIQAFLECFQYFKQITRLQFHIVTYGGEPIFDKTVFFDCLSAKLGALVQLQSLDLKIMIDDNMRSPDFLSVISALQRLENLQNLVMNFSHFESPDECIISLAESLKNLNNLQILTLHLKNHEINRKSLEIFFHNIAHLPLKSLGLVLSSQSMHLHRLIPSYPEIKFRLSKIANLWKGKQDPASLFSPFFAFKLLTTLNLDLTPCYISTEEFKYFSAALKQMNKLSSLTLKLPQFDPNNNFEGLQSLLACFGYLQNLISLDLNYLGACVHDQELAIFGSNLRECRNLQDLCLRFPRVAKLNGTALDHLLFGLQDLIRLKTLYLTFYLNRGFEENDVWKFLSGLIVLKNLEVLQFCHLMQSLPGDLNAPLPAPLKEFENLRHLSTFISDEFRYI